MSDDIAVFQSVILALPPSHHGNQKHEESQSADTTQSFPQTPTRSNMNNNKNKLKLDGLASGLLSIAAYTDLQLWV